MQNLLRIWLMSLTVCTASCLSLDTFPTKAVFHNYQIHANVDSKIAQYYLQSYLTGERQHPVFDDRIRAIYTRFENRLPTRDELKDISNETSVDFAAIFYADKLLSQPENKKVQSCFQSHLTNLQGNSNLIKPQREYSIVLVPGYDYTDHGAFTGANLAAPRRIFHNKGFDVHFIPIDAKGSVEENASVITNYLDKRNLDNVIIAGPSSAGPAIHLSLASYMSADAHRRVYAWMNLGGILNGVPLLDWILPAPQGWITSLFLWREEIPESSLESMATDVSRKRFSSLTLPSHIKIINYMGLSLSGNIAPFAYDQYRLTRLKGPNDGLTLLPDMIAPRSQTILSPSTGHFFAEDPEIDLKTYALFLTLTEECG
ncbi:MAG: hypothetical protein HRU19_03175 [Pseudobacteriovorax sp.]|nr:hypothetical protein [Pseudobacteriovorax sp.]